MNEQLIGLLQRDEDLICEEWMERLSDTARLAGQKLSGRTLTPVRMVLQDLVRVLQGKLPGLAAEPPRPTVDAFSGTVQWRVNLAYAVEVLLTGEVVIRNWACTYLDLSERQQVEVFELINRGFHNLQRVYALQYCQACHAALFGEDAPAG